MQPRTGSFSWHLYLSYIRLDRSSFYEHQITKFLPIGMGIVVTHTHTHTHTYTNFPSLEPSSFCIHSFIHYMGRHTNPRSDQIRSSSTVAAKNVHIFFWRVLRALSLRDYYFGIRVSIRRRLLLRSPITYRSMEGLGWLDYRYIYGKKGGKREGGGKVFFS